jgi:hypothetical protein
MWASTRYLSPLPKRAKWNARLRHSRAMPRTARAPTRARNTDANTVLESKMMSENVFGCSSNVHKKQFPTFSTVAHLKWIILKIDPGNLRQVNVGQKSLSDKTVFSLLIYNSRSTNSRILDLKFCPIDVISHNLRRHAQPQEASPRCGDAIIVSRRP